jgi:hypothetical protein
MAMLPATLREALRSGRVVPIVGAGVSRTVRTVDGAPAFPSWAQLLERAAQRLDEEARHGAALVRALINLPEPQYAEAIKNAAKQLGPALWSEFLRECFDRRRADIDERSLLIPRAIWALGSKLLLTTNFDRVLRWACPNADDLEEASIEPPARSKRPYVWHLYGSIREPHKMVLEPGHDVPRPRELNSVTAGRHALLLGYDVDDQVTILQFGATLKAISDGPHYVLARPRDLDRLRRAASGVDVSFIEFSEYGPPLEALLHSLAEAAGSTAERTDEQVAPKLPTVPPGPKPWDVYLGYAEPDRELAERLSASLHARGLRVFFDRWEIGPGMIVEKKREQGIRDSLVGVLLVSQAWTPQVFEDFFALLHPAVVGELLLIPVLLDDTVPPAKLAIRQPVDLRGSESAYTTGVEALVSAVQRARAGS